jgi:hypothetical protein
LLVDRELILIEDHDLRIATIFLLRVSFIGTTMHFNEAQILVDHALVFGKNGAVNLCFEEFNDLEK